MENKYFIEFMKKVEKLKELQDKLVVKYDGMSHSFITVNYDGIDFIEEAPRSMKDKFIQKRVFLADETFSDGEPVIFYSDLFFQTINATDEDRDVFMHHAAAKQLIKFVYPEIHRYHKKCASDSSLKYNFVCDSFCVAKFGKDDVIAAIQKQMIYVVKTWGSKMRYSNDLDELDSVSFTRCRNLAKKLDYLTKRIEAIIFEENSNYWVDDSFFNENNLEDFTD